MMHPTIGDYYRSALEQLKKEIENTADERVIGMDPADWVQYLIRKHGMEEIVLDGEREPRMEETTTEYKLRGYDIYTDRRPGTVVRETAIKILVPVHPS